MAKKNTKEAYWFKHDQNAQDDPKCVRLIDKLGPTGYGIFWLIVEKLRGEADHSLPLDMLPAYARRWNTTLEEVEKVVKDYKLFVVENGVFWSNRLRRQMEEKDLKSQKAKESIEARWAKQRNEPTEEEHQLNLKTNVGNTNVSKNDTNVSQSNHERTTDELPPNNERASDVIQEEKRREEGSTSATNFLNTVSRGEKESKGTIEGEREEKKIEKQTTATPPLNGSKVAHAVGTPQPDPASEPEDFWQMLQAWKEAYKKTERCHLFMMSNGLSDATINHVLDHYNFHLLDKQSNKPQSDYGPHLRVWWDKLSDKLKEDRRKPFKKPILKGQDDGPKKGSKEEFAERMKLVRKEQESRRAIHSQ